jgi:uncharacterized protein YjbJ (UPF0337 family)
VSRKVRRELGSARAHRKNRAQVALTSEHELGSDQGNWKQLKGQAKQRWGDLTDDDLDRVEGRQEELEGLLHERYRKTREEARREIDEWPGASDGADLDDRSPASAGLFSAALAL